MNYKTAMAVLLVGATATTSLIATAAPAPDRDRDRARDQAQIERDMRVDRDRDFDRDRSRDRDRLDQADGDRDQDRDRDRIHQSDYLKLSDNDIYGSELMTAQERNQYRQRLQEADSEAGRNRVEEQHQEQMQKRAENQGVAIKSPGQGIYGGALMTVQERNQYRERLQSIDSNEQEKKQFLAQHREEMQIRARQQGVDLPETEEAE